MVQHKVLIDGINFVSQNEINNIICEQIQNILSNDCGLREDIVRKILKKHHLGKDSKDSKIEKKYEKGHPRPQNAPFKYNKTASQRYLIKNVDKFGKIYHAKNKYSWNMDCVLYIRKHMFKGMTSADVHKICDVVGLNSWVVERIMYNIENGFFDSIISTYENLIYQKQPIPIQNNPQKRKECYGF